MKDIQRIIEATASRPEATFVLATVVNVVGSAYRRPGARMLIASTGETWNAISGGCLERDVVERATDVFATGIPRLVTYDLTSEDVANPWGLGMGCNGAVTVFLESFDASLRDVFETCFATRRPIWCATVVRSDIADCVGLRISSRSTVVTNPGKASDTDIAMVIAALGEGAKSERTGLQSLETTRGAVEIFIEFLEPPIALNVFGAGYDAVPLVRLADELGWQVNVFDHRPAFALSERFPTARSVLRYDSERLHETVATDDRSAAIVMTHNFHRDREILEFLVRRSLAYVGVLGPRRRTQMLIDEIGVDPTVEAGLFSPVGLDIGAETAEEIALAILAEIRAVFSGHRGGFLKDRKGPIHV